MRRLFYLHTRNGVYYAEIVNQKTGKKLNARSTGHTDRDSALLKVAEWLRDGIPPGRTAGNPAPEYLVDYLLSFWDYERSAYIAELLAHGHRMTRRHALEMTGRVKRAWKPYFENKRLENVTRRDLQNFGIHLSKKGLAAGTINVVVRAGTTALKWAYQNELIPTNPAAGLVGFSGECRKRGILTLKEGAELFRIPWKDERSRIANLLSATTGLRQGEILGLRVEDIGIDRIFVRHSWSPVDGLKGTKTNTERTVPLLPAVRKELMNLIEKNPYEGGFIFYSANPEKPIDCGLLLDGLHDALIRLSIGDEKDPEKRKKALTAWRERGICFHSWRHFYARQISDQVDMRTAKLGTGHATDVMVEHYANHAYETDFAKLAAGSADAFGQILNFR